MNSRALALATLLMTAATILSKPVAAAELGGPAFAGPGLDATVTGGPLNAPRPAIPVPTPRIVPGTDSRNIPPLDFEQLVDSYATVTHLSDGTTTLTPASAALRALLQLQYDSDKI
jgi:hypothetical protein